MKQAVQSNTSIKISDQVKAMLDAVKDPKEYFDSILLNFLFLGCGIAAITIAFTLLNAATFGVSGLVLAGLGVASIIAGVGLFAYDHCKTKESRPQSNLEYESLLSQCF